MVIKALNSSLTYKTGCTKIQAVWSQTEVNTSIFIHMLCFLLGIKVAQIKIFMLILLHIPRPPQKKRKKKNIRTFKNSGQEETENQIPI